MTNSMTSKNIPELRFPGFEGEWKLKRISDLGRFMGGGTPESNHIEYWQGSIPWISSSDVNEGNILDVNITRYITEDAIDESATKRIPEYSVLIVSRVGIGKFAVNKLEICTSQDFTNLIPFTDNSLFLAYFFTARQKRFLRLSQGTSIKGFTGEDIGNIKFHIPTLPEQQKIATFLSSLDQRIQLLTRKKEQLELYKKGVMQQIFSRQLRFKDEQGKDYPEWEERRLGEIGKFKNGLNKDKNDFGYGYPFVNLMDVFGKSEIRNIDFGLVNAKYSELMQYDLKQGDVLFIRSSVKKEGVGEASVVLEDLKNTLYSGFLIRFRNNVNIFDLHYKKYCFSINKVRNQILSISTTSANTNINQESLNSIMIDIPSIEEQQKIASFLSSVDDKITRVNTQIEQTRKWKQGLLQKMFV